MLISSYLHVAMQDLEVVKRLQSTGHLDEYLPELFLREIGAVLDVGVDLAHQVASLGILHDDAQRARAVLEESFLVSDDVRVTINLGVEAVLDRREDACLVDRVFLLFLRQLPHFHLLSH